MKVSSNYGLGRFKIRCGILNSDETESALVFIGFSDKGVNQSLNMMNKHLGSATF